MSTLVSEFTKIYILGQRTRSVVGFYSHDKVVQQHCRWGLTCFCWRLRIGEQPNNTIHPPALHEAVSISLYHNALEITKEWVYEYHGVTLLNCIMKVSKQSLPFTGWIFVLCPMRRWMKASTRGQSAARGVQRGSVCYAAIFRASSCLGCISDSNNI